MDKTNLKLYRTYMVALKLWNRRNPNVWAIPKKETPEAKEVMAIRKAPEKLEDTMKIKEKNYVKHKNPWLAFLANHTKHDDESQTDFFKRMAKLYHSGGSKPLVKRETKEAAVGSDSESDKESKQKSFIQSKMESSVSIPVSEFKKEHKNLIEVLETGSKKAQHKEAEKQEKELNSKEKWLKHFRNLSDGELAKIAFQWENGKKIKWEENEFEAYRIVKDERIKSKPKKVEEEEKETSSKLETNVKNILDEWQAISKLKNPTELQVDELSGMIQALIQTGGDEMVNRVGNPTAWILNNYYGLTLVKKIGVTNDVNYYCPACTNKQRFDNLILDYKQEVECPECEVTNTIGNWYRRRPKVGSKEEEQLSTKKFKDRKKEKEIIHKNRIAKKAEPSDSEKRKSLEKLSDKQNFERQVGWAIKGWEPFGLESGGLLIMPGAREAFEKRNTQYIEYIKETAAKRLAGKDVLPLAEAIALPWKERITYLINYKKVDDYAAEIFQTLDTHVAENTDIQPELQLLRQRIITKRIKKVTNTSITKFNNLKDYNKSYVCLYCLNNLKGSIHKDSQCSYCGTESDTDFIDGLYNYYGFWAGNVIVGPVLNDKPGNYVRPGN